MRRTWLSGDETRPPSQVLCCNTPGGGASAPTRRNAERAAERASRHCFRSGSALLRSGCYFLRAARKRAEFGRRGHTGGHRAWRYPGQIRCLPRYTRGLASRFPSPVDIPHAKYTLYACPGAVSFRCPCASKAPPSPCSRRSGCGCRPGFPRCACRALPPSGPPWTLWPSRMSARPSRALARLLGAYTAVERSMANPSPEPVNVAELVAVLRRVASEVST